ncbi:hypothetical protein B0H16DRAFT_1467180 [Mycena metata]|uniref:Kinesin light chain n=1 Tax=Mycena metata TaxID=1033252 RepID=A0AAD7I555_9AGAR|nr:hypothetical protein B0H16DRAFT_1467180 [Mycena metata]
MPQCLFSVPSKTALAGVIVHGSSVGTQTSPWQQNDPNQSQEQSELRTLGLRKSDPRQNLQMLMKAILRKLSTLLGKDHPETLTAMGNLAATYSELGHFKEARGLELTAKITLTPCLLWGIFTTHSELGDFVKAKELRLIVLEKQTILRGEDHPETLKAMKNLAMSHSDLGDFEGAKKLEALVLERFTKLLGEDHPKELSPFMCAFSGSAGVLDEWSCCGPWRPPTSIYTSKMMLNGEVEVRFLPTAWGGKNLFCFFSPPRFTQIAIRNK